MLLPVFIKGSDSSSSGVKEFQKVQKRPVIVEAMEMDSEFEVHTLEGTMRGKPGDYLIRGVKGELYICDRDIFHQTYDIL